MFVRKKIEVQSKQKENIREKLRKQGFVNGVGGSAKRLIRDSQD